SRRSAAPPPRADAHRAAHALPPRGLSLPRGLRLPERRRDDGRGGRARLARARADQLPVPGRGGAGHADGAALLRRGAGRRAGRSCPPRERLLLVTGVGQALTAATLGTLTLLGLVRLEHLLLLTLLAGVLRGLEHAARQSYTHDVVGPAALLSGLAVLGVSMRVGWLLGSLGVGAVIAHLGSGTAYLAVALGFLGGGVALLPASASPRERGPAVGSLW